MTPGCPLPQALFFAIIQAELSIQIEGICQCWQCSHLAPKQILINAHVNLRDELVTGDIVQTIEEVEDLIRRAEPKVEMIFLEAARQSQSSEHDVVPKHIG